MWICNESYWKRIKNTFKNEEVTNVSNVIVQSDNLELHDFYSILVIWLTYIGINTSLVSQGTSYTRYRMSISTNKLLLILKLTIGAITIQFEALSQLCSLQDIVLTHFKTFTSLKSASIGLSGQILVKVSPDTVFIDSGQAASYLKYK